MTEAHTDRRFVRRRGLLGLLLLGLTLPGVGTSVLTIAWFTDSQSVGGNGFTTGTIDVSTSPSSAVLTAGAMMPGDSVNGSLVVTNNGSAQLRYALSTSAANGDGKGLREVISLTIKSEGASCATFNGTTLYAGVLAGGAFGNSTPGGQLGDRALNAGTSETLCFRAELPTATGNEYQGATTTATFTFDAEQTANNP
ncbi:MAG: CalY family protein [Chloroflexota bacterium]|nr:CalY family protein [Chloroflexota bacterium]